MQQGRKSSGGQGLPDRAAEEQATTRGRKRVRKAFQCRIFLSACCRFCPGTAYIVVHRAGTLPPRGTRVGAPEPLSAPLPNRFRRQRFGKRYMYSAMYQVYVSRSARHAICVSTRHAAVVEDTLSDTPGDVSNQTRSGLGAARVIGLSQGPDGSKPS